MHSGRATPIVLALATTVAGASRPDVIELNIRGVLNDTADTTGVLDDIDGTSLDWNLRAQAEWSELRGLYEINPSTIDGSLAGLDLMASGGFVNQSATRVSFDGVASNRLSMLGGFLAFPMDSLDFVISAAVRFDDGSTFGFQFAGFVSLPLDIYDYGDDVLEEDMIVNPFELRDTFAGAVQTTGSITGYSVSIVPTPATVGVVAVGGIVASRRRR